MRTAILAVFMALLHAATGHAVTPLAAGAHLPAMTLADQHDVNGSLGPSTRCVVFSRDMGAATVVNEALAGDPALITAAGGVVVSDISAMPRIITKLFALPALRKRPYRILLDRDGKLTASFPSAKGKVTVLHLHALTVDRVDYVETAAALRAVLRQEAAAGREPPTGSTAR